MTQAPRIPTELRTDQFLLRPLRVSDAARDFEAVMESRASLRIWEQSGWPADDFTVEANREDLARLKERHDSGESFTFTISDPTGTHCLGCVYIFPTDAPLFAQAAISPLGDAQWSDFDRSVYFWVRESRWTDRLDQRVLASLERWFREEGWGARALFLTSELFDRQVELFGSGGRSRCFELLHEGKAGKELAFSAEEPRRGETR